MVFHSIAVKVWHSCDNVITYAKAETIFKVRHVQIGNSCVKVMCHRLPCNFVDIKLACLDTKHFSSQTRH